MSDSIQSPLARLVLFIICIAIAGTFVAGAHYHTVELPAQQSLQAPTNDYCTNECYSDYQNSLNENCKGSKMYAGCATPYLAIYQNCVYECNHNMR